MRLKTAFIRLYGILLHLYPADFRQAYADAMTCIFEESLGDAFAKSGPAGALKLCLHTLTDLATTALSQWASRCMVNMGIEQRTSLGVSIVINIVLFSLVLMAVNAGRLHPRPSTRPLCGEVSVLHSSSSAHRSANLTLNSARPAR